jgi:hypothetical protein
MKPRNHCRRCFSSDLNVWTASVLQNAPVVI